MILLRYPLRVCNLRYNLYITLKGFYFEYIYILYLYYKSIHDFTFTLDIVK